MAVVAFALIGWGWTAHDPDAMDISHQLEAPSLTHGFGTDALGRDVLSRVMAGAHESLGIAALATLLGLAAGTVMGLAAASARGALDGWLMRGNDLIFAFPSLLLAILITAVWGPGAAPAIIAIGVFNIPVFARVTRGAALVLWQRDFVLAARVAGRSTLQISLHHILPNLAPVLIVQATLQLALGILAESALAYVGLGAQPPAPSWGRMLSEAQTLTALAPWLAVLPGAVLLTAVLGFNLLGDGLRDRLDRRA